MEQKAEMSHCVGGHYFCERNLNANSVVVDLGANRGDFSKSISNESHCKVYAVEQEPAPFSKIPVSDTIKKYNYAIAGENGPVDLCLSDCPDASTIVLGLEMQRLLGDGYRKSIIVNAVTLESFLKEIGVTSVECVWPI